MSLIMSSRTARVLPLAEIAAQDAFRTGPKAANLGDLLRAGFAVPAGFVLTADAFREFLEAAHLGPESDAAAVKAAPLPEGTAREVVTAVGALGDVVLAVRSSGLAEDGAEASFAGQYDTVLGVRGAEEVLRAVSRCWASAFAPHVVGYRLSRGIPFMPMAVLVQRQLAPDAAGVAFSADPVTGERAVVVVSAVRGLGDRLVSGAVSPDEWTVRGEAAVCLRAPEQALDAPRVRAVAEVVRRAEAHFGRPQDVEWALCGETVFMLQSRPITALPELVPVSADAPVGYWQRDAATPRPRSPLDGSLVVSWPSQLAAGFSDFGLLVQTMEWTDIGGWPYVRMVPIGGKEPPPLPAWLAGLVMPLAIRMVPALRQRARLSDVAMRTDLAGRTVEAWYQDWLPASQRQNAEFRALDLASLADSALLDHLQTLQQLYAEGFDQHFRLIIAMAMALRELAEVGESLLGWDDRQIMELVAGQSPSTVEPAYYLANVAESARSRPLVAEGIRRGATVAELAALDPVWAAEFELFRQVYGCRPLGYVVAEETLAERPDLLLAQLKGQLQHGYDPLEVQTQLDARRAAARTLAESRLAGRPADLARFRRVLDRAERAYPTMDGSQFHLCGVRRGLLRYAAQEAGGRLTARGLIAQRDDVFYLEMGEISSALIDGIDSRAVVFRRRGERAWALAHPGPASYGRAPGPPPSLRGLPPALRHTMGSLLWMFARFLGPQSPIPADGDNLPGVAAAPGRYTGPVCIVRDESQFDKLRPGDILVCPLTSPVWSVLFPVVGALVTDSGGILSHPAIIAREHRVPAVVGTQHATDRLRDGQIVTVDGDAGLVIVTGNEVVSAGMGYGDPVPRQTKG
ncbi:MAG: PEP-utilizing enzyme [Thermaerobacter sp.]|nr:PEP-utilizing enzyme [Thermaerobacter sp.]